MSGKRSRKRRKLLAASAGLAALTLPTSSPAAGPAVVVGAGTIGDMSVVTADGSVSGTPAPGAGLLIVNGEQWTVTCSQIVQEGAKMVSYKSAKDPRGFDKYMKIAIDVEPGISTAPSGGISGTKTSIDKCGAGGIVAKGGDGIWAIQKRNV